MIERLELRNWRAFDHVTIDFQPGTTFLVAPNGVGKTSLLLGLTWGLFGDHSKVNASSCVRVGHNNAEVAVTLGSENGAQLVIFRTVTTRGRSTVTFSDGQNPITSEAADALLASAMGAPIDVAARLAIIRGPGNDGELQLNEHLYDAFGVSSLRHAAAAASKLHKKAETARKKLRTASRELIDNRDQLTNAADNLARNLEDLATKRASLVEQQGAAARAQQAMAVWHRYEASARERTQAVEELLKHAHNHGFPGADLAGLSEDVSAAIARIEAAVVDRTDQLAEARAQAIAGQSALDLLEGHDPSCPTCARPFHNDEFERAIEMQRDSLARAQTRIQQVESELGDLGADKTQLVEIRDRIVELSKPLAEPDQPRPAANVDTAVSEAENALREHDERAGSIDNELKAIVAQLQRDNEVRAAADAEKVAWRREALTYAASMALNGTAERLANEYIEPISQQVRWRWKALFGEDGLQLRPDGTIVRVAGDRELPWSELSSGEQIWARLAASLLVLRSSTTLPFAWLDEPLEHLDPRTRRIVARDLATTSQHGRPAQLIVTTYEHTLARQLAEDLPNTHLRQISRVEPTEHPPRLRPGRSDQTGSQFAGGHSSAA